MKKTDAYTSIVVLGAMNPPIHHPAWYASAGIFSEEEAAEALKRQVMCQQTVAECSTEQFRIICIPDRWQIETTSEASVARITEIADKTFTKLNETPVSAYGFNHNYDLPTELENVGHFIATCVISAGVGPAELKADSATVTVKQLGHECDFNIVVSPSKISNRHVQIKHNAHYITPATEDGYFDLGSFIRKGIENAAAHARQQRDHYLKVFDNQIS